MTTTSNEPDTTDNNDDSTSIDTSTDRSDGAGVGPVIPPWLRDKQARKDVAGFHVRKAAHVGAFHAVRSPVYAARLTYRSPIGAWRVVTRVASWVWDPEEHQHVLAAQGEGFKASRSAREARRLRLRGRVITAMAATAAVVVLAWSLWANTPLLGALMLGLLVLVLGVVGRNGAPITDSIRGSRFEVPQLDQRLVTTALGAVGIPALTKAARDGTSGPEGIGFPEPITRDGKGWRAAVDLPTGVTAADVLGRRAELASGLRRPVNTVWPEADPEIHAGRLVMWVADRAPSKGKPVAWPLADKGTQSLFSPVAVGVDVRGRPVGVTLMFASVLIGAQPRMGKSFTARLLALGAALDPTAQIHIYDLRGGADWLPFEQVAHQIRLGSSREDLDHLAADLTRLQADMERRGTTLRSLGRERCPEGKVTPELAADKTLGLHPVFFAMDECHVGFNDPAQGKDISALVEDLMRRGPAVGITVVAATQRLDAKSIPTPITAAAAVRICLRVIGQMENDMVLGTGSYRRGYRASEFGINDKGMAYVAGEGDEPTITRTAYIDAVAAEKICARARAARITADRLTGFAAGHDTEVATDATSVLHHLAKVWPAGSERMQFGPLGELLADAYPELYAGWDAEALGKSTRAAGIPTVQVKTGGTNRRGITRTALHKKITESNPEGGSETAA